MPTPSDTLHAIRGAANVNSAALSSIKSEVPGWLTDLEAWNPTPSKGLVRDQLARTEAAYQRAKDEADRLSALAEQAIDQLGTGGDPDVLPPSTPWSTGELQVAFGINRRPAAGQELGRYLVVENVFWDELLSQAVCDVAATTQSDVIFWRGVDPVLIFRYMPTALHAIVLKMIAESVPGDVLIITAPAVQDLTLSGIAGTAVGRRLGA